MSKQPEFKPPPFFTPVEVEFFNPLASFRQSAKDGNFYSVKFLISRELWELFEENEAGLHLKGHLYRVYDNASDATPAAIEKAKERPVKEPKPKKERKEKPLKGEHGQLWKIVVSRGLLNSPDLWERLAVDGSDLKEIESRLRDAFSVTSRTFISADAFVDWAMANRLDSLASMMRLAEKDLNARQAET